jgi:hypothetical protein
MAERPDGATLAMPMSRHAAWTLDRWADFGQRCRAAGGRISELIAGLSGTEGLTGLRLDALIRVGEMHAHAMAGAEETLIRQHPGSDAMRLIRGEASPLDERPLARLPAPAPTREGGDESRARFESIRADLAALSLDYEGSGATKPRIRRFQRTVDCLDRARSLVEEVFARRIIGGRVSSQGIPIARSERGPVTTPIATDSLAEQLGGRASSAIAALSKEHGPKALTRRGSGRDTVEAWGWRLWSKGGTRLMREALDQIERTLTRQRGEGFASRTRGAINDLWDGIGSGPGGDVWTT